MTSDDIIDKLNRHKRKFNVCEKMSLREEFSK